MLAKFANWLLLTDLDEMRLLNLKALSSAFGVLREDAVVSAGRKRRVNTA